MNCLNSFLREECMYFLITLTALLVDFPKALIVLFICIVVGVTENPGVSKTILVTIF